MVQGRTHIIRTARSVAPQLFKQLASNHPELDLAFPDNCFVTGVDRGSIKSCTRLLEVTPGDMLTTIFAPLDFPGLKKIPNQLYRVELYPNVCLVSFSYLNVMGF